MPRWLAESLGVSLAAQAATLPIILVSFGRLAILSPLVNLLVVPLVAPAMAAGVVALGGRCAVVARGAARPRDVVAAPGWVILRLLVTIVDTAASLPFASVTLQPPLDTAAAALSVAGIAGVTWWRRRHRARGRRADEPPREPRQGTARHVATAGGRAAPCANRLLRRVARGAAPQPGGAGSVVIARPAGIARISSWTSARAMPSSSKARAAAACSSTVGRTRAA